MSSGMQIGLTPPVSLAMRMRSEASMGQAHLNRGTLPVMPGRSPKHAGPIPQTSTSTPASYRKPPGVSPFERLSGSHNFVASCSGGFADRHRMINPTAACVRCAEPGSMCMACCESLAQEALNFYRKTRARGAASLFANAITQTGITKVVKFAIFKIWVNGMRCRQFRMKKIEFAAEKAFKVCTVRGPFRAWRTFVKNSLVERKNKTIEEHSAHIVSLEQQINKAVAERKAFEQQAKWVDNLLKERDATIALQTAQISDQTQQLEEAKRRVVGLCTTTVGPLLAFNNTVGIIAETFLEGHRENLMRELNLTRPAHDYSMYFDGATADIYRSLGKESMRRKEAKKITKWDESTEIIETLLAWVSAKSRVANLAADSNGNSLNEFLPKYRVVETLDDISNGQALFRVVVALIFDATPHGTKRALQTLPESSSTTPLIITGALLEDIKSPTKSHKDVVSKVLNLAHKYLQVPLFHCNDIISGAANIICTFMGHLMLASSPTAVHATILSKVEDMIKMLDAVERLVRDAQAELLTEPLTCLDDKLLEYRASKEMPLGDVTQVVVGAEGELEGAEMGENDAEKSHDPVVSEYSKLLAAVDSYIETMSNAGSGCKLTTQVNGLKEAIAGLTSIRTEVSEFVMARSNGMQLATTVRTAIAGFQYEMLLDELHWTVK